MVHIKFTARPRTPVVSPSLSAMALQWFISNLQGVFDWAIGYNSRWDVGSEDDNASDNTGDRGNASDNGGHVKIGAEAALADVSYDFGRSKVMRGRILYLKNSSCLFLKGFAWPPGIESVPDPKENEVVVFEDFFVAGFRIPPHPVLLDILHKFCVQLHQLMPNAIV
jgi:hypothetical protein